MDLRLLGFFYFVRIRDVETFFIFVGVSGFVYYEIFFSGDMEVLEDVIVGESL